MNIPIHQHNTTRLCVECAEDLISDIIIREIVKIRSTAEMIGRMMGIPDIDWLQQNPWSAITHPRIRFAAEPVADRLYGQGRRLCRKCEPIKGHLHQILC